MSTHILVFSSDQHSGSTLGLLHPDGVPLDDQQLIKPSPLQSWLWEKHEEFIGDVMGICEEHPDATRHYFQNGDLTDGWHHGTHQVLSPDEGVHIEAATQVLAKGILRVGFDSIHMTRGTPAHVKKAAGLEKAVANRLNADGFPVMRDPKHDTFMWPHVYAEFGGLLIDVRHHGRTSGLARMRKSHAANYAQDIWQTHVNEGKRPPHIAVRSHKHQYIDSGPDHRGMTRLIQLGCWQFSSEWVKSKSLESMPDIGGMVIVVRDGDYEVRPLLYQPDPEPQAIWRP